MLSSVNKFAVRRFWQAACRSQSWPAIGPGTPRAGQRCPRLNDHRWCALMARGRSVPHQRPLRLPWWRSRRRPAHAMKRAAQATAAHLCLRRVFTGMSALVSLSPCGLARMSPLPWRAALCAKGGMSDRPLQSVPVQACLLDRVHATTCIICIGPEAPHR